MPASARFALLRRILTILAFILVGAGIGTGITFGALDMLDRRPATLITQAFDANTITYRDGRIQLYFSVKRIRDCPTTTTRWLWTWVRYKGEELRLFMPLGVSFTGVTDIGSENYIMSLAVPSSVWDSTWYYYARSVTQCGGLMSLLRDQVSETQSIPIVIKGTSQQAPKGVKPAPAPKATTIPLKRAIIMNGGEPLP